jgi:hypothetical protein
LGTFQSVHKQKSIGKWETGFQKAMSKMQHKCWNRLL